MSGSSRSIRIRGARTHNLRGVDVELPLERLVVFTGPSGSGKSSLAFDTIHAESVRRFAGISGGRDEPEVVATPDVAEITGLGVTVGASTRTLVRSSRSTVATLAGIAEPMRRLFSIVARPTCTRCGGSAEVHDVRAATERVMTFAEGTRVVVLALVADSRLDDARATLEALGAAGFVRARIDGTIVDLAEAPRLDPRKPHRIEVVVDRFVVRARDVDRVREAIELAYRTSSGSATVEAEGQAPLDLSMDPRCTVCGAAVPPLRPGAFSPADPDSACETCGGSGLEALQPRAKKGSKRAEDDDALVADGLCPSCSGTGVREGARNARAFGFSYLEVFTRASVDLVEGLATVEDLRARALATSIGRALGFLRDVGLGHLALGRRGSTLSTGEASRARLAGPFANELVDVTYVLDEPTAGLHPRERPAIVDAMRGLVRAGNSVLVVEHDPGVVEAADLVVELGPGAGDAGGSLVFVGPPGGLPAESFTGRLGRLERVRASRRATAKETFELDLEGLSPFAPDRLVFPVGRISALAGPSGSGKSTLLAALSERLAVSVAPRRKGAADEAPFDRIVRFDDVAAMPGPRSIVATRLGIFGALRETFAELPEARARGYTAGRFGLTAPGGRCDVCEGRGVLRTSGSRGPASEVVCPRCGGSRYDVSITAVRYRGASLVDVFAGSLADAHTRFEALPAIERPLAQALRLGLGHLSLGRAASSVSAGESTRLRLAAELGRRSTDRALLLLDEPCRGLSTRDAERLGDALDELVEKGATIVVAEHAVGLLATADHLVDLARDGGLATTIAARGRPDVLARGDSPTAPYLARVLADASVGS